MPRRASSTNDFRPKRLASRFVSEPSPYIFGSNTRDRLVQPARLEDDGGDASVEFKVIPQSSAQRADVPRSSCEIAEPPWVAIPARQARAAEATACRSPRRGSGRRRVTTLRTSLIRSADSSSPRSSALAHLLCHHLAGQWRHPMRSASRSVGALRNNLPSMPSASTVNRCPTSSPMCRHSVCVAHSSSNRPSWRNDNQVSGLSKRCGSQSHLQQRFFWISAVLSENVLQRQQGSPPGPRRRDRAAAGRCAFYRLGVSVPVGLW